MNKSILILALLFSVTITNAQVKVSTKKGFVVYTNKLANVNDTDANVEELAPVISEDGQHLFFVRGNHPENIGEKDAESPTFDQDIWYSKKVDGVWSKPTNLGEPINNQYHNVVCGTNEDGTILYLSNVYDYDKNGKLKEMRPGMSYSTKQEDGTWSKPKEIIVKGIKHHHIKPGHFYFHRSKDGKILLFSADVIENKERRISKDEEAHHTEKLFVCFQKDGESMVYDRVRKLPENINKEGTSETAPFLSQDGMKLYFTRVDKNNKEELQVTTRKSKDEAWTDPKNWTEPEKIYKEYVPKGSELHHNGFEGYFFLHRENKSEVAIDDYGVLAMSLGNGRADIYELNFRRYHNLKIVTLEEVEDENGKKTLKPFQVKTSLKSKDFAGVNPIENNGNLYSFYRKPDTTTFKLDGRDHALVLDTKNKTYEFDVNYQLPEGYHLLANQSKVKWKIGENIFQGDPENDLSTIQLVFTKTPPTPIVTTPMNFIVNVNFDWDKAYLRTMERKILDALTVFLKNHKEVKVGLYGHTDNTGTPIAKNNRLSKQRTDIVFSYLTKSIKTSRIEKAAYSEFRPIKKYDTETRDEINRRTEIVLNNIQDIDTTSLLAFCDSIKSIRKTYIKDDSLKSARLELLNAEDCFKEVMYGTPPRRNCRVFFTGAIASGYYNDSLGVSKIYQEDASSEYVGAGEYANNSIAFPKAVATTFDGIAIGKGTRVIIYSKPNFQGEVLLDKAGPVVINNVRWKNDARYQSCNTETYPADLQALFPPSRREWSDSDMNNWSFGSVKIICE